MPQSKGRPKKKGGNPLSDKEQSERFIEAAWTHEFGDNVDDIDARLAKVISQKNYNSGN